MRTVGFSPGGFDDFAHWIETDRKTAVRILKLLREIQRNSFEGSGKPEPLRHELRGAWSRRIDDEHRLIYEVTDETIKVLAYRYHY